MTDRERYKRTFSVLQASEHCFREVTSMNTRKRISIRRLSAVCAAAVFVIAMASFAYAADVGGIQRTIQIWINGEQTTAVFDIQDGTYTVTYPDADGNPHEVHGGGVAFEDDGTERPLTEEEILENLDSPEVSYAEDGTVWVYYRDQALDITDTFDDDGISYVQVKDGDDVIYMTVKYQKGHATSPHSYVSPDSFNCDPE